ncbi:MAG: hypothetical protein ABSB26_03895 [Nitrososphaerales archaeon]
MWDLPIFDRVSELLDFWIPGPHRSEKAYREDLYEFLLENVRRHPVKKEASPSLADLGIGTKVAIELKFDFSSKAQADKLFTQIAGHLNSHREGVFCVFCGRTSVNTINYVKTLVNTRLKRSELAIFPTDRIRFVYK